MSQRFSRQEKAKWVASPSKPKVRSPIRIPEGDNQELIEKNALTLVGRVSNPRVQNAKALVNYMLQFWNLEDRVSGMELGQGKFQFSFIREEDLQLVLSWSPFHFKHWMFIIQRWEPVISEDFPSNILFWIQLQGVPQHYWTEKALRAIGDGLGKVETTDTLGVRIRVHINALQPLEKQLPILLPSGETVMINLEYERLEKHCFDCFSLNHEKKDCPLRGENLREDDHRRPASSVRPEEGNERGRSKALRNQQDSPIRDRRFRAQRRPASKSPTRRRSPPRAFPSRERGRGTSDRRRREDYQRRDERRSSHRVSSIDFSQRPLRSQNLDRNSVSKHYDSEWRRRQTSDRQQRSNDPTSGGGREQLVSHRESNPVRHEVLNTPQSKNKTSQELPPPPVRGGEQSSPKTRRPGKERLSGGELGLAHNALAGVSSSMSGRLQDVNIQYLGDEEQDYPGRNVGLFTGSSSNPIHPTLGHRLSVGNVDPPEELRRPASQRLGETQHEITVSIPAKPPTQKNTSKRKGTGNTVQRGIRSPLQGASSKKRNATKPKVTSARKRLCPDQVPSDKGPISESQGSQPPVKLIPAAKKTKPKVDFQKPPNPLP